MNRWLPIVVACLALPCLAGCSLLTSLFGVPSGTEVPYNPKDKSGELAVQRDIQFTDIPVPIGFILRRDSVFSFRGTSFRFGRFTYEGAWTLKKTSQFYQEQMPVCGWTLQDAKHALDRRAGIETEDQTYAKGRERCRMNILSSAEGITVQVRLTNIPVDKAPLVGSSARGETVAAAPGVKPAK